MKEHTNEAFFVSQPVCAAMKNLEILKVTMTY